MYNFTKLEIRLTAIFPVVKPKDDIPDYINIQALVPVEITYGQILLFRAGDALSTFRKLALSIVHQNAAYWLPGHQRITNRYHRSNRPKAHFGFGSQRYHVI